MKHEQPTSSVAANRTETTPGPISSVVIAMEAIKCQPRVQECFQVVNACPAELTTVFLYREWRERLM